MESPYKIRLAQRKIGCACETYRRKVTRVVEPIMSKDLDLDQTEDRSEQKRIGLATVTGLADSLEGIL